MIKSLNYNKNEPKKEIDLEENFKPKDIDIKISDSFLSKKNL